MVDIHSSPRYKVNKKRIGKTVSDYFAKYSIDQKTQVNVIFAGVRKMRQIAKDYKGKDTAHPVLTFSYKDKSAPVFDQSDEDIMGEIFICYPHAVMLAAQRNKTVNYIIDDLVIHGLDNITN